MKVLTQKVIDLSRINSTVLSTGGEDDDDDTIWVVCGACGGSGESKGETCGRCDGAGGWEE